MADSVDDELILGLKLCRFSLNVQQLVQTALDSIDPNGANPLLGTLALQIITAAEEMENSLAFTHPITAGRGRASGRAKHSVVIETKNSDFDADALLQFLLDREGTIFCVTRDPAAASFRLVIGDDQDEKPRDEIVGSTSERSVGQEDSVRARPLAGEGGGLASSAADFRE